MKQLSAVAALGLIPNTITSRTLSAKQSHTPTSATGEKIWACLLHLSFNFAGGIKSWGGLRTEFEPEQSVWDNAIISMASHGVNMVLINLDDSILWRSHPEISLRNSWTPERLREELEKIRKQGIEPIPMLNFAATHDA